MFSSMEVLGAFLWKSSSLSSLLWCVLCYCKKKYMAWHVESKNEGKVMSRHLMPIHSYLVTFLFLSFQCFLPYLFPTHNIFQCKDTHGKGNDSTPLGIRPMNCLFNFFYTLFVNIDSIVLQSRCLIFLRYDLTLFSPTLSTQRLWSPSW